jgi:hypothetical protein
LPNIPAEHSENLDPTWTQAGIHGFRKPAASSLITAETDVSAVCSRFRFA